MITEVFKQQLDVDLGEFPIMTYQDAAFRFGSDKPDLRVKLEFTELTDVMADVDFKVFSDARHHQGWPRGGPARARWRRSDRRAARSTPTPSSSRSTAPRAWPGSRSTKWPRAVTACSRPS